MVEKQRIGCPVLTVVLQVVLIVISVPRASYRHTSLCPNHLRQTPISAWMLRPGGNHAALAATHQCCCRAGLLAAPAQPDSAVPVDVPHGPHVVPVVPGSVMSHTWPIIVMQWYERTVLRNDSKNPLDSALVDPWTAKTGFGNLAKNRKGSFYRECQWAGVPDLQESGGKICGLLHSSVFWLNLGVAGGRFRSPFSRRCG